MSLWSSYYGQNAACCYDMRGNMLSAERKQGDGCCWVAWSEAGKSSSQQQKAAWLPSELGRGFSQAHSHYVAFQHVWCQYATHLICSSHKLFAKQRASHVFGELHNEPPSSVLFQSSCYRLHLITSSSCIRIENKYQMLIQSFHPN